MCVLLGFLQKTSAIPIMNPLSWFMIVGRLLGRGIVNEEGVDTDDNWGMQHHPIFHSGCLDYRRTLQIVFDSLCFVTG